MSDDERWILVLGATGRQGGSVARHLLKSGWRVHAFVRDLDKPQSKELAALGAELACGDLDDPASVHRALTGAYGVFTVFTPTHGNGLDGEVRHAKLLADAAAAAGVQHLVHSSVGGVENPGGVIWRVAKLEAEEHLRASGVPATFLRPVYFMENFLDWPPVSRNDGSFAFSRALYPHTKLQVIASQDIGFFVADAFGDPDHWIGRAEEIAGEALSGPEIASAFARHTRSAVTFDEIPIDELRAKDPLMAKTFEWFNDIGYRADIAALRAAHPDMLTFSQLLEMREWTLVEPVNRV
ncbi:NmrA/HSCARG family protein [Nocardia sp. NBC_01388]|uniref:NmrA/HSCARG family protein n=1 Tax=Nocardia sp. NBC_01388 TaxID=2903596 RepID=UPI0032562DC1